MPIALALLLAILPGPAGDEAPRPSLSIRLVRPQRQGERVLALFEGARSPHPAAALAAYRRAKGGSSGLSKATEAAIASINPQMVRELASLDDATLIFSRAPDGRLAWNAVIPRDDGTFAALATAFALTGGWSDPPLDGQAVDRFGPRNAAVSARTAAAFVLAANRDDLRDGLTRSRAAGPTRGRLTDGMIVGLDPRFLAAKGHSLAVRRAGEALLGLGCIGLDAKVAFGDDGLSAVVTGRFDRPFAVEGAAIRPQWLGGFPRDSTLAAFAFPINPSSWDRTFAAIDRAEKADPARAGVAPIRVRLNLLAAAAGVRPEVDLWPLVAGVSGVVTVDPEGRVDGVLVRVHARDEDAAARLRATTVPRVVAALRLKSAESNGRLKVEAGRREFAIDRRGDSIAIAWGPTILARSYVAEAEPGGGAGPALPAGADAPRRFAAAWPGRLRAVDLPDALPVSWVGNFDGNTTIDRLSWPGLGAIVRRVVDRLPFDAPPDVATVKP